MKRLLLIEDEDVIRRALTRLLARRGYEVVAVGDVAAAIEASPQGFDLVLADLRLPGRDGTTIIPLADPVPVVVMTSHASVRSAVEAMRAGASDYIAKPFDHDELLLVLDRALGRNLLGARNRALERDLQRAEPALERIDGTSLKSLVKHLLAVIEDKADPVSVLHLHGEPGCGREDIARCLHARGSRADAPLLVVDAGDQAVSLPEDDSHSGGLLRTVRGGTLVLRHPEYLSQDWQARIVEHITSDRLRVITISASASATLQAEARLEPSLGHAMASHEQAVLPLRGRRHDITCLATRAALAIGRRHTGCDVTLSATALAALAAREWPGNIVELETLIAATIIARSPSAATTRLEVADFQRLPDAGDELDLDAYFRFMVMRLQGELSETELAARLGMSRKALWERRQRMGLPRKVTDIQASEYRDD